MGWTRRPWCWRPALPASAWRSPLCPWARQRLAIGHLQQQRVRRRLRAAQSALCLHVGIESQAQQGLLTSNRRAFHRQRQRNQGVDKSVFLVAAPASRCKRCGTLIPDNISKPNLAFAGDAERHENGGAHSAGDGRAGSRGGRQGQAGADAAARTRRRSASPERRTGSGAGVGLGSGSSREREDGRERSGKRDRRDRSRERGDRHREREAHGGEWGAGGRRHGHEERNGERERGHRGRDRSAERGERGHGQGDRHEAGADARRPEKRRREDDPGDKERVREREQRMEAGGEEAAASEAEAGQAAPAPGVVLEIAREGKLVGRLELGLREAKDKVMLLVLLCSQSAVPAGSMILCEGLHCA